MDMLVNVRIQNQDYFGGLPGLTLAFKWGTVNMFKMYHRCTMFECALPYFNLLSSFCNNLKQISLCKNFKMAIFVSITAYATQWEELLNEQLTVLNQSRDLVAEFRAKMQQEEHISRRIHPPPVRHH